MEQCWAVLENKLGNIRRARELFDAATVADKRHIAAWHGWAVLELKQGNVKKARQLLTKASSFVVEMNKYIKDKLHKKSQPLGVFSNKILTNFFFQIKSQPLKCYQKKPSLDNCTGNVEFFVEISYI